MEWNHDAIQQIFREPSEAQGVGDGDGDGNGRLGIGMERTNQSTQGNWFLGYRIVYHLNP